MTLLSYKSAATSVLSGGIIAYPTEAIFGLGCDPQNQTALQQLLDLKVRSSDKGLILVGCDWKQLAPYVELGDHTRISEALSSWPGPVTWIMPASKLCTPLLTGGRTTIAVRVSAHDVVKALCEQCGHALISTSANLSGQPPFETPAEIIKAFSPQLSGVVEGELGGLESATSIFDASTGVQLR